MSILDSFSRNIKNIFVGSHKGDDVNAEWVDSIDHTKNQRSIKDVDRWFKTPHPHDSMPVANGSNRYAPPEKLAYLESNPRPEEDMADWFSVDEEDGLDYEGPVEKEEEKTIHQKMYEIATARYNPFSLGGSENCDSDLDCNIQKHSPWPGGSENFQARPEPPSWEDNAPCEYEPD
mgnify:CR=1 FL=1